MWGLYPALVDGEEGDIVRGWAYLVESREHEDRLRFYETNKYEVVRCEIWIEGSRISGLAFRFCGKRGLDVKLWLCCLN
ncbi:hypothetical protein PMIN01_01148 [Paraphaeosphaeria minitans]|uniref:Gamma-glutamylcyclotransferase AIG2-like domain-containing protein n=1 Tax=Paraphaeosphaeria minitans TaxID=565426 RepID=A0A9P6KX39_9PLEO|nr:hypothetical protein PMIN01_01148 [Paraphaeosphaeria minitans]